MNLTDKNCDWLHDLWLATGLSSRTWDSLDGDAQAVMADIWRKKHFDWAGLSGTGLSECWNRICSDDGEGTAEFDMRLLLPTRLDVEINGFNGGLLAARDVALAQFGETGQGAWAYALNYLRTELDAGFYFWRDNIW
ncbi:hypothetical protein XB02_19510 [Pantoea ananatis]|nr:hypothetical protein XB02_19510 [Pantoea ananatis]